MKLDVFNLLKTKDSQHSTDQKAGDSNSPGRATKTRGNVDFRGFLFARNLPTLNGVVFGIQKNRLAD